MKYRDNYDEKAAKDAINAMFGFDFYEESYVTGWNVLVRVHTGEEKLLNKDGSQSLLYVPDSLRDFDKYVTAIGQILDMGPYCFTGEQYAGHDRNKYPFIGEWVRFSQACPLEMCRGVLVKNINDNSIRGIVKDPTFFQLHKS